MGKDCECCDDGRPLVTAHPRQINERPILDMGENVVQADRSGSIGNTNSHDRVGHQNCHPTLFLPFPIVATLYRAPAIVRTASLMPVRAVGPIGHQYHGWAERTSFMA